MERPNPEGDMAALVVLWLTANVGIVGLLGLGWLPPLGAVVAGVVALSLFTMGLIRAAAAEMEAAEREGSGERGKRTSQRRGGRFSQRMSRPARWAEGRSG
jgi:hypothetical protein